MVNSNNDIIYQKINSILVDEFHDLKKNYSNINKLQNLIMII